MTRDKSYYISIITLAIPICLQQLITFSVGFTDNIMVGTLGDTAISGVYMGNQIQTLMQLVVNGIGAAMGILTAQYWGKKDVSTIKTIIAIACRFALVFGLIMTFVAVSFPSQLISLFTPDESVIKEASVYLQIISCSYIFFAFSQILVSAMRSVEKAKIGLVLSIITLATNFSLNWTLIFGHFGLPALGAKGAAIGTLISRIIEFAVIFVYVIKYDNRIGMKFKDFFNKDAKLRNNFVKFGLPVIGGDVVWSINLLAQSAIMGRFNSEAITAISIASTMNNMAYIWVGGMWSAVGIITSKTVGAGKYETMKEYARTTQVLFLIIGFITGGILFLIKEPFLSLFAVSDLAAEIARQLLGILCITIIGTSYQATCLGGLVKAGGDTAFVFKNDSIFVFLVLLPFGIITMMLGAPVWLVFLCLKSDQILKCIVAVFKINSFNWMKNLTETHSKN